MMKKLMLGLALSLAVGLVIAHQQDASARPVVAAKKIVAATPATCQVPVFQPEADVQVKKCSFDSDCSHGKCRNSVCGGCSFDSDCKGWGKCRNSHCGGCSFNSDCSGFGECRNSQCTKAPF